MSDKDINPNKEIKIIDKNYSNYKSNFTKYMRIFGYQFYLINENKNLKVQNQQCQPKFQQRLKNKSLILPVKIRRKV